MIYGPITKQVNLKAVVLLIAKNGRFLEYPIQHFMELAHKFSSINKEDLKKASECACYYCCNFFCPTDIVEWVVDRGYPATAVCPNCGIDAIIPKRDCYPWTVRFLVDMRLWWFSAHQTMDEYLYAEKGRKLLFKHWADWVCI